jgi:hypothetical protein
MCNCRRYGYLGVTEEGRWFRVHEQRPVAKRKCCLPSSEECGEGDETKGMGTMGGRREETPMEKAGANNRQDEGRIEAGAQMPCLWKQIKASQTFSARTFIGAHINHDLRGKGEQLPYPNRTTVCGGGIDNKCHAHTRRRKVKGKIRWRR